MNRKRAITGLATAVMLFGFSSAAFADRYGSGPIYDYAHVISARPIVRYVTIKTPVRECWRDTEYYSRYHRSPGVGGGTLAGSLIGAAIGNDVARRHAGPGYTTRHERPVRRCETRYRSHREERIDGYDVLYRYKGQKYSTRMPYDPGRRIKVRVDIRPAR